MSNTDSKQDAQQSRITMSPDELFERHPLPWSHHVLMIKDANGRQVIHTGGLYDEYSRTYEGAYLSGLNALLVQLVNTSRASVAAPEGDDNDDLSMSVDEAVAFIVQQEPAAVSSPASPTPVTFKPMSDLEHYAAGYADGLARSEQTSEALQPAGEQEITK